MYELALWVYKFQEFGGVNGIFHIETENRLCAVSVLYVKRYTTYITPMYLCHRNPKTTLV